MDTILLQGVHQSRKVTEFSKMIFQGWNMENKLNNIGRGKSGEVMENDCRVMEFL